jgi:hypothetical protein
MWDGLLEHAGATLCSNLPGAIVGYRKLLLNMNMHMTVTVDDARGLAQQLALPTYVVVDSHA